MRAEFQGEVVRDQRGREVVRFTTASGVCAVFDTSISQAALLKLERSLKRKIARRRAREVNASAKATAKG